MKKLVLLLQNPKAFTHLNAILILLFLANCVVKNPTLAMLLSFTYVITVTLYSYNSGFLAVKTNQIGKQLNILSFACIFFLSIKFVMQSFFSVIFLYHFGKINVSEKELLNMDPETSWNIFILFILTTIIWLVSVAKLRKQGIKSGLKLMENEKTPQT